MWVYLYPNNTETELKNAYIGIPNPTSIVLDKSSISLTTIWQTEQLTATIEPTVSDKTITWSSDDTTIATVSTTGLVTCVTPWTCTITATTVNGLTASCSVTQSLVVSDGYYDMITDSFYSDSNHTNLITPIEWAYYKYIRYTTPIFYQYVNWQFIVQKKNATTNTKNTTLSLSRSTRRELCTWNGRWIGIVSWQGSNYAQLMKRTDIDTVTVNTEISSVRSHLYAWCWTRYGTIVCWVDGSTYNLYSLTLDYDNNTISSSYVSSPNSVAIQWNTIDSTGTVWYFICNNSSNYAKAIIDTNWAISSCTGYTTSSPSNVCWWSWSNWKIVVQWHTIQNVGIWTPASDWTSISWTTSASHWQSWANSVWSDRKWFIVVGNYNSSVMAYSFDQWANWSTMTAQSNTWGQIYVDEIWDIWYTSESSTSNLWWIRFWDFKTEAELS